MGLVQTKDIILDYFGNIFIVNLNYTNLMLLFVFQLGANAILAFSLAFCKAGAAVKRIPLYKVFHESVV